MDVALKMDKNTFNNQVQKSFGKPNPGSAFEKTMNRSIETGKIQRGELGKSVSNYGKSLEGQYGMKVDISAIKNGGLFDNGTQINVPNYNGVIPVFQGGVIGGTTSTIKK